MTTKTRYSIGFAVSPDGQQVLLLRKGRPAFLAGAWIGVGGHIEEGETAHEAMVREAKEEADLDVPAWKELAQVERPDAEIAVFAAFVDLASARTMTDEPVQVFSWEEVAKLRLSDATEEVMDRLRRFAAAPPARPTRNGRPGP